MTLHTCDDFDGWPHPSDLCRPSDELGPYCEKCGGGHCADCGPCDCDANQPQLPTEEELRAMLDPLAQEGRMSDHYELNGWEIAAIVVVVAAVLLPDGLGWYPFGVAGVLAWVGIVSR